MLEDEVHMIAGVLAKYYSLRLRAKGMIHYLMHALYLHGISISVEYTQLSLRIGIIHVCVCERGRESSPILDPLRIKFTPWKHRILTN